MEIKELVQPNVGGEVQTAVEKREEPEHAPELDQSRQAQQLSQRSNCQGDEQQPQSPVPSHMCNLLDGVGSESRSPRINVPRSRTKELPQQYCKRQQADNKDPDFDPPNHGTQNVGAGALTCPPQRSASRANTGHCAGQGPTANDRS